MTLQSSNEPMTAEAFAAFCENAGDDGRHELLDGQVLAMASERATDARTKNAVLRQLERQIAERALPCEAFPDNMAVRVDDSNVFEPDASVRCGPRLAGDVTLILDPVIVVEVASPSTQRVDLLVKFARYFRNPSVMHYLIIVPTGGILVHHRRTAAGAVESTSHDGGTIVLEPPGLTLDVPALLAG